MKCLLDSEKRLVIIINVFQYFQKLNHVNTMKSIETFLVNGILLDWLVDYQSCCELLNWYIYTINVLMSKQVLLV